MSAVSLAKSSLPASLDDNTTKQESAQENQKSAQKVHRAQSKTHSAYWLTKVKKTDGGASYGVQIAFKGERRRFPLQTADKTQAAERARDRFLCLVAHGWQATLEKYKPEAVKASKLATIGEWLESVRATAEMRQRTFIAYSQALRKIASDIAEIGDQPALDELGNPKRDRKRRVVLLSRKDAHGSGRAAWIAKVEALPLSVLSAAAVQRWKLEYIARAGSAPDARKRAENTVASLIRCARSLFSAKARKYAAAELVLPEPLPFAGIELPKKGNTAYASKVDAAELIQAARTELEGEPFKIFSLGLLCGLRKREIDLLTWAQVDFEKAVIRIERTEYFSPKSEDSVGEVDLDAELVALLRGWKALSKGPFVIESKLPPLLNSTSVHYRCRHHFATLYEWLRGKGITAQKPLHELRKELGAILASNAGIFAAQSVLRHAQISTTAAYYTDKKRRISAGLGVLLSPPTSNIVKADFNAAKQVKKSKQKARTA
jgi:integrase